MIKATLSTQELVHDIRRKTADANQNNLTRTKAYLTFYLENPEMEWAFLAHLVSRNGGWNMTDLRGSWLPLLLDQDQVYAFFTFLERCNWLIFYDAYAQLLLYTEMKRIGSDLTHVLTDLGVSQFMIPLWREFLQKQDSAKMTQALIINEQQYIEQRVIRQTFYKEEVLGSFAFAAQSILSLNQIIIPYLEKTKKNYLKLVGISVHNFPSLEQRIHIGKTLYKLIFEDRSRFQKILAWAKLVPHTGSRADYWPHLFTMEQNKHPKLFSPTLTSVWQNSEQPPADGTDWYHDRKWYEYLQDDAPLTTITEEDYLEALNLVEAGLQLIDVWK